MATFRFPHLPVVLALALPGLLAACSQAPAAAPLVRPHGTASADRPVVVELFQSQGCSSCPPANANVNALADRPDVLALSFGVTYWDQLGWKDTFASPRWTARQWDYAHAQGRAYVATPQVVLNGSVPLVGSNRAELDRAIDQAGAAHGGPALQVEGHQLHVGPGRGTATLWLVRYDPRVQQVPIRAGENDGRTLPHRDIVRTLDRLGDWHGEALSLALPPTPTPLAAAILVQQGPGGPIVAARKL